MARAGYVHLAPPEAEIAGLLERGLSDKDISSCAGLRENIVMSIKRSLFAKCGVHSRLELVTSLRAPSLFRLVTDA